MSDEDQDLLATAVSARLARLGNMPVDTSRVDKMVRQQIPQPPKQRRVWFARPVRAVAASLLLMSAIAAAIVLSTSGGPALADSAQMAQVYQDIVSGRVAVMQVDSIEAANRMLNSQSPGAPSLPRVPESHVMACCMKSVHNKKMACVLLKNEGVPVTLAVASASDMKMPTSPVVTRKGVDYRVQRVGELSMVMTERDGKWLCLIGQLPAERLMDVAAQVQF